jgi:hypothetical protein
MQMNQGVKTSDAGLFCSPTKPIHGNTLSKGNEMGLERLDRRDGGLLSESPVETAMTHILEEGPGLATRAGFYRADGWRAALHELEADPEPLLRHRMVVFPQAGIRSFRADFMVVVGGRGDPFRVANAARHAFIVECDGREYHASSAEAAEDLKRESLIRRTTGLDVLRFSGPEILYRSGFVSLVLGARAEALAAVHELGWDVVGRDAARILRCVSGLSSHFLLRREYVARNTAFPPDPWRVEDPAGEQFSSASLTRDAELDPFVDLRVAVARLRHTVAQARQISLPIAASSWDEDLEGRPRHIGHAVAAITARIIERASSHTASGR